MVGNTVSHYKILEKLGEGGMGVVYKAQDIKLKRTVALKFLPSHLTKNKTDKARFLQEAQAAAALNHNNVCTIHEIHDEEDNPFIVMEYVEGRTLREVINTPFSPPSRGEKDKSPPLKGDLGGCLPIPEAISISIQIAEALKAAHAKGIFHRDIKSENIMVTETGQVKVMDFGLAKLAGSAKLTKTGLTTGTAAFMSPEQFLNREIDHRTDIWSFGVVLYEMLTGQLPFQGDYDSAVMYSVLNEEPRHVKALCSDCPDALSDMTAVCLQKEPEKRFGSMQEIVDILEDKKPAPKFSRLTQKHNLPAQLTSFIGRDQEIETVKKLISENRLVTLTGAGGCGKSRLAIQIANSVLVIYPDGVWIVELAPITVPENIDQAIAGVFNVKEQPGSTLIQILMNYMKSKKLLLVLDNCEHLIAACSGIVEQILRSTTDVTILTTSREALNVADEVAWRVPSLSLPQDEKKLSDKELSAFEAIQLFVTRAKNKKPDFKLSAHNSQTVLQICQRLDGIPLAIELAASRLNVFTPELILSRLDDRFRLLTGGSRTALERHKTLQATIDWSYDLLTEHEKTVFHRLSVFVGGFDLEAYEKICDDDTMENENSIDLLTGLIEKSLVVTRTLENGEYRYQLLETIRHYAKGKLLECGESDTLRESHFQYYCGLAEKGYMEQLEKFEYWINRLELEHENIIAALEWVKNDLEKRLHLAGVLGWFWVEHSHYNLGLEYLKDVDVKTMEVNQTKVRAITCYGWLLAWVGDPKGFSVFEESLKLWDKLKDIREKANFLFFHSMFKSIMADYTAAQDAASEINNIAREIKNDYLLLRSKTAQTFIHISQLQVDSAEPLAEQNIRDAIALKANPDKTWNLHFHADCALMRKDYKETEKRYVIAMKGMLERGDLIGVCTEMTGVAFALSGQGRYIKALSLKGAIDAKYLEFGASLIPMKFWMDWIEEYIEGAKITVGEKTAAIYDQEGRDMGFEKAVEYALDFDKD